MLVALSWLAWHLRVTTAEPHLAMYVDEPWYLEAATSLLRDGKATLCEETWSGRRCVPYPKSIGWPLVLATVFAWTGASALAAVRAATVLGVLTVPLAAACVRALGGSRIAAALAAFGVALYPAHVAWSSTAETNVPGAFFVLLGVLGFARATERWSAPSVATMGFGLSLASAIRPEASLALIPVALATALAPRWTRGQRASTFVVLGLSAVVAVFASLPMWALNAAIAGEAGFLSTGGIATNLAHLHERGDGLVYPASAMLLGALGVFSAVRASRGGAAAAVLVSASAQALVALAFHRFADRMLLPAVVCALPVAALVVDLAPRWSPERAPARVRGAAQHLPTVALAALFALGAWTLGRRGLEAAQPVPHTMLLEVELPGLVRSRVTSRDALVVTEWPTVVAHAGDVDRMSTREALSGGAEALLARTSGRPVYFVCDMFCEPGFAGGMDTACPRALETLRLEPVATRELGERRYGLYRVVGAVAPGEAPPEAPCPFIRPRAPRTGVDAGERTPRSPR